MKKQILNACTIAALSLTISHFSYGQTWLQSAGNITSNPTSDKVGIGTTNPSARLTVHGNFDFHDRNSIQSDGYRFIRGHASHDGLVLFADDEFIRGSGIAMEANSSANPGTIGFVSGGSGGSNDVGFNFMQYNSGAYNSSMTIQKNGWVGIGTSPLDRFTVNGNIGFSTGNQIRYINGRSDEALAIFADNSFTTGSGIFMSSATNSTAPGKLQFTSYVQTANSDAAFEFAFVDPNNDWEAPMTIRKNGKVTIGKDIFWNAPNNYLLYVQTGILTEKIKVALHTDQVNWSDFVFADDYALTPLSEVEEYVKKNKHLPEIPSAEEVYRDGLDLAQMDAKLLQKIEELTLYMIELKKDNTTLRNEIEELKSKLNK